MRKAEERRREKEGRDGQLPPSFDLFHPSSPRSSKDCGSRITHNILPRSLFRHEALVRHREQRLYSSFVVVAVGLEDLLQDRLFDAGEHRLEGCDLGIRRGRSRVRGRVEIGHLLKVVGEGMRSLEEGKRTRG